ncbi:MAG: DUF1566 domain-containing protein [Rhodocyclaceae bacterium]|jgi:hypothetical protein|nr:DUF1566 domain-containing protein [Rhodocyclaceae bacterium]
MKTMIPLFFAGLFGSLLASAVAEAATCQSNIPPSNPDGIYVDHGDGTVTDTRTSLMWKKCVEGLSGPNCDAGYPQGFLWRTALEHAESHVFSAYNDWRLPSIKELRSLVEECRSSPALNTSIFPASGASGAVWSSTPSPNPVTLSYSFALLFSDGVSSAIYGRMTTQPIRLVRGGQSFADFNAALPGAPTGVSATAGSAAAMVSWVAPAHTGDTLTAYTATSAPGGFTCGATPPAAACEVTGLSNGTAYTFTVVASNAKGDGPVSASSAAVTPKGEQAITFSNPGAQNFGTTPTLIATSTAGLAIGFTSSTPAICTITEGGALSFLRAGICTINATQSGDTTYLPAEPVSRSFTVYPVAPGAPTGAMAMAGNGQVTVTWSAPVSDGGSDILSYLVTSSPDGRTCSATAPSLSCTVVGLTNGTAYTFNVRASNADHTGPGSSPSASVTPLAPHRRPRRRRRSPPTP